MPSPAFTGQLKKGEADGTIVGYLKEHPWGWTIRLIGTRDPSGGYTLSGVLGEPPQALRISLIDDAPANRVP